MLTEQDFQEAAKNLNVEVAAIKALTEVESNGRGFWVTGELVILFEPHVFWRELRKRGIDPNKHVKGNEDILYQKWGTRKYPVPTQRWAQLNKAIKIHKEAAYCSASYGAFQLMGFHFRSLGYPTAEAFVEDMKKGMHRQLAAFVKFLQVNRIDKPLREKNWHRVAEMYNGPGYLKNDYHNKLAKAFIKWAIKKIAPK